ncbi:Serine/threonine-protein phosphatase 7 long form-like protein [Bienertia sinuspersici]
MTQQWSGIIVIDDLRDPFEFDEPTMVRDHRDRHASMECIREFHDKQHIYLSVTDKETEDPRHGTRLTVYHSLRRAEGIQPSICEQNFLSEMSRKVEQENASATYVLKNTFQERPATSDLLPMLGRSIKSNSVRWGSNQLRIHGDFNFIAGYWEWTEDILFRFEEPLQLSSIYDAVYASLYSYAKDINIMRAFCESWCPTTNTLHTQLGELSISLWDLYKLGGLPISGEIYETIPPYDYFLARDKDGDRVLPQAYGVLKDRPTTWTRGESALFDSLGIFGESRRQTTYVAAFLSCWLCAFVLPENDERLIRPSTFEMATLMARGAQGAKCFNGQEARALIHEGSRAEAVDLVIESDPSRTKRKSPNDARDVAQPHRIDSNPEPIAKTQSLHISSRKDDISTKANKVFDNDKSTSDAESDVNFKHQRGRRSKKPRVADSEGDETDFGNAFDNIPIPSDIPTDLTKMGDIDFEMGASFNVDDAMIEEATEPLNVLTDRTVPGKGKDIHIEKDLVERSNPASPAQSQHSLMDLRQLPHMAMRLAPSISTIRVTPASQGIFTSAIKILGNEYLTLLKQTPFDKVSDRHGEASQVYKAIRMMHGDPEPLKCKVDGYVWAVKGHLALKASLSDRRRSDQVEEERLAAVEELKLADYRASTKRRVEELEAVPVCSAEEMELFEEQERKLLEFQSSLDSSEWIV